MHSVQWASQAPQHLSQPRRVGQLAPPLLKGALRQIRRAPGATCETQSTKQPSDTKAHCTIESLRWGSNLEES